jgi:endonuclease IV
MPTVKENRETTRRNVSKATPHRFGSHLSIAGGMHHAIEDALRLGFDTVQVFVKNQRPRRSSRRISSSGTNCWRRRDLDRRSLMQPI